MPTYGNTPDAVFTQVHQVALNGDTEWLAYGAEIDWSTVGAASSVQVTLPDGAVIPAGIKHIPGGTVMTLAAISEVQTVNLAGGTAPTGGTFTISFAGETTVPIAFNATAVAAQSALEALATVGIGNVAVTLASSTYTLTFSRDLGNVPQVTVDSSALTAGGTVTVTIATSTGGTGGRVWGPCSTTATDGRQNLTRGQIGILNATLLETDRASEFTGLITGGKVYRERLQCGRTVVGAVQPTFANTLAVLPRLEPVG